MLSVIYYSKQIHQIIIFLNKKILRALKKMKKLQSDKYIYNIWKYYICLYYFLSFIPFFLAKKNCFLSSQLYFVYLLFIDIRFQNFTCNIWHSKLTERNVITNFFFILLLSQHIRFLRRIYNIIKLSTLAQQ